jgi:hypothetical protein
VFPTARDRDAPKSSPTTKAVATPWLLPLGCVALLTNAGFVVPDLVGEVAAEKASYPVDPRRLKPQGDLLRSFGADMIPPPVPMLGNSPLFRAHRGFVVEELRV